MTKNVNGDLYSDLITSADPRAMACGVIPRKTIDRVVIHHNATTNANVAISTWLANGSAQTSAHYEVDNDRIIGIVGEKTTAWHAGNGDMNARSIGIENVNNTGAPNWTISDDTFESLAKLVADICKRYGLPIDSTHVIPHKAVVSTACPGGIDVNNVINRANEIAGNKPSPSPAPTPTNVTGIQAFNRNKNYLISRSVIVDELKWFPELGIYQFINYDMIGGKTGWTWANNGVPLNIVSNITRGNSQKTQIGDLMTFDDGYKSGTIDSVDWATNGIGIKMGVYGMIWFNADWLYNA